MSQELDHIREELISLGRRIDINNDHHRSVYCRNFNNYIQHLKTDMLNGEISISPDILRVDWDVWKKCRILSDKGFVIGGSVILNLYGFIDRPVGDIDVWLSTEELKFNLDEHEPVIDEDGDEYDEGDHRVKVSVEGVGDMDVFNYKIDYFIHDGVKIHSPFHALKAKSSYKRVKDVEDFSYMVRNI